MLHSLQMSSWHVVQNRLKAREECSVHDEDIPARQRLGDRQKLRGRTPRLAEGQPDPRQRALLRQIG